MLSAIVPVSNMRGQLQKLTSWVHESTKLGIEIVLVHDFQDQATENELKSIVEGNNTRLVKLLTVRFRSPGLARNFGIEHANGEWITFWDSDDQPDPKLYLDLVEKLEKKKKEIGIGNFIIVDANDSLETRIEHRGTLISTINHPGLWRYIFKKTRIEGQFFEKMRMGEDQLFLGKLKMSDSEVFFSDQYVYQYFTGQPNQLTSNPSARNEIIDSIKRLSFFVSNQPTTTIFTTSLQIRMIITLIKIGHPMQKAYAIKEIAKHFLHRESRRTAFRVVLGLTR